MKNVKVFVIVFVAVCGMMLKSTYTYAALDLTSVGSSGYVDGGFFAQTADQSTGSGAIHSFVRLQTNNNVEKGYNTSGRALLFDENNSPVFTRDLLLSDVPKVTLPNANNQNTVYRQFLLDINQQDCGKRDPNCTNKYLSLDKLSIYLGSTGGLLKSNPDDLGSLVFRLTSDSIKLNYALNSGSGSGDMFAYIPDVLFTGNNKYVYLYSQLGAQFANNAGFEEWAVLTPKDGGGPNVTPEPASAILFTLGLLGGGGRFLRRKKA